jgi:hypothetical protein
MKGGVVMKRKALFIFAVIVVTGFLIALYPNSGSALQADTDDLTDEMIDRIVQDVISGRLDGTGIEGTGVMRHYESEPLGPMDVPTDRFDITAVMVGINNLDYPYFLGGTGNPIAIVFPRSALGAGTMAQCTILVENTKSETGAGKVYYLMLRGKELVWYGDMDVNWAVNTVYAFSWSNVTLPNKPGDITLLGLIVRGSNADLNLNYFKIL